MSRLQKFISSGALAALALGGTFFVAYQYAESEPAHSDPPSVPFVYTAEIVLQEGLSRAEIGEVIGGEVGWSEEQIQEFVSIYAQMEWAALNTHATKVFIDTYALSETDQEIFTTQSTQYLEPSYDFLGTVYASGMYEISSDNTPVDIAQLLIKRFMSEHIDLSTAISVLLDTPAADRVRAFISREGDLLPDLVPLPPEDVAVIETPSAVLLAFSTIYYNQGRGPLELRADPATMQVPGDFERDVAQRIYRVDGTFRERPSGTFFWHTPHIHYHFADFVIYDLEAVDAPDAPDLSNIQEKATFCIRDVSRVALDLSNTAPDAEYRVCGRERQGISVGWGDTYFATYSDQNLNITELPSGIYRLSFIVNPSDRFDEVTLENNTSSVLFELDMDTPSVTILERVPADTPAIEHIYEDQPFE